VPPRRAPRLPHGLVLLRSYSGRHLPADLLAGLLVAALAVPQSLGYAAVAGVPVQVGLYTLPPSLLAYALFGSSRLLFVGPVSTVSVLSGSVVRGLSGGDPALAVQLTSVLALSAGGALLLVGLLRAGWVAQFLSEPIVAGFVAGLVVLIVVGEVPGLSGLPSPNGSLVERLVTLARDVPMFHGLTLTVGLAALAVLFAGQRLAPRVPWSLLVLVGGILVSNRLGLAERGVVVVGEIPSGLPLPSFPVVPLGLWAGVVTGGLAIGAVAIAEGLAAARTFSHDEDTADAGSDDREFVATGAANLASGVFGGMGVGGSLSKTAANARAGAFTQVSSVAAGVVVLLFVAVGTGLLTDLPRAVLSAVVIHAVWGLVQPSVFRRYAAVRRNDLLAALAALVGVLLLGPLGGLLLAVGQSLLGLVYRSMQVHVDEMGRVAGEKAAWGSVRRDATRRTYPGILVLRPDGPLFWANATSVTRRIEAAALGHEGLRAVVLDLEATGQMDTTSAERLTALLRRLRGHGVDLHLVRVFGNVRDVLGRSGFLDELGPEHVWHSISAGVKCARNAPAFAWAEDPELEGPDDAEHIASRREGDDPD
jgi:SulP family sulfate permease